MEKISLQNRTFILGLISFLLSLTYILICIYVFLISKKNSVVITILIRASIGLMLFSFVFGTIGLIKAKKDW